MSAKEWSVVCVGVIIAAAFALYVLAGDEIAWQKFKSDHNCRAVWKVSGNKMTKIGSDHDAGVSIGVAVNPPKTGWVCDDGTTHWR